MSDEGEDDWKAGQRLSEAALSDTASTNGKSPTLTMYPPRPSSVVGPVLVKLPSSVSHPSHASESTTGRDNPQRLNVHFLVPVLSPSLNLHRGEMARTAAGSVGTPSSHTQWYAPGSFNREKITLHARPGRL
jgi:hypothetical protein